MNRVNVVNIFPNAIAVKSLDLTYFKLEANNFKKSFESKVKTTLNGDTLFSEDTMNYLNIQMTDVLSYLLKPYCKNFVFKIIDIWINKYEEKDYQGTHVHPSDFSFIIYYQTDKSHTVFNSPIKNILETINSNIFDRKHEPNLKEGDLLIFPSYLQHWVRPNSGNMTISGNIKIIDIK